MPHSWQFKTSEKPGPVEGALPTAEGLELDDLVPSTQTIIEYCVLRVFDSVFDNGNLQKKSYFKGCKRTNAFYPYLFICCFHYFVLYLFTFNFNKNIINESLC